MEYEVIKEVISFRDIHAHFKENPVDNDNWLLLSTGGWHGTYKTLEDCERILKGKDEEWLEDGAFITVLIVCPSKVAVRWGEVHLKNLNEVEWLRNRVKETLEVIQITQEGNTLS